MAEASQLAPIRERLVADHAALRAAVERVPEDWRERRTHADRWSVAEILEHLGVTEKNVGGLIARFVAAAPQRASGTGPLTADANLRELLLDRSKLIDAPAPIQPTGMVDSASALKTLEEHRTQLFETINEAEDRDLTGASHPHRVFGPLNGYQWLLLAAGHEARHAAQIGEIADHIAALPS